MTEIEFQTALKEFYANGGQTTYCDYQGPRFVERTFVKKGYVASMGAQAANLKDQGIRK